MAKYLLLALFFCNLSIGQTIYKGKIVTKENDTLSVEFKLKEDGFGSETEKLMALQEKVRVVQDGKLLEYSPKDLNSFTLMLGGKIYLFDNMDDTFFAQRMYSNNVKLYKFFRMVKSYPNSGVFRVYLIKRPNGVYSEMVAMGLSRLLTKKTMLPVIEDCQISYNKIKNDEIKIKDEEKLVEFIKDYENNCFIK